MKHHVVVVKLILLPTYTLKQVLVMIIGPELKKGCIHSYQVIIVIAQ